MAVSSGSITEELICSICLETFDTPVLLPCAHSFCKQCLLNVQERGKRNQAAKNTGQALVCPQCRKECKLGSEGIEGLPKNTSLANIVLSLENEKRTNNLLCEVCDYEPAKTAAKICSDCSVTYCTGCFKELHPMRGAFKYHAIKEANISQALRCLSPVLFDQARRGSRGRLAQLGVSRELSGYGTDGAESGNEDSGVYANQDQVENVRRQIKSKKKELTRVTKAVQSLLKTTEDETEERMREIRSICCQINESIGEKEASMLTIVSQKRHEAVRQCLSLSSEVKAQQLSLDLLEDQVNDIVSLTAVHTGTDVTNDVTGLRERVAAIQSRSLITRSKQIPRQPKLKEAEVGHHIAALDFVKENNLVSPVFTELAHRPVNTGPSLIDLKWSPSPDVGTYRLDVSQKDNLGFVVKTSVILPGSTNSYTLRLPGSDAEYDVNLLATSDEGEKYPEVVRSLRTLPYIYCFRAKFNPASSHKRIAVSLSREEVVHRKCKYSTLGNTHPTNASFQRFETLEGAMADEPLPILPHVYWEAVIHFRVFGKLGNSKLLCDLGVCKSGCEDESSLLCDNPAAYCCYLVRRNNKIALEFWNGPNRETLPRSIPVLDLNQDSEKIIKIGFYWDALKRTFALISPGPNAFVLASFQARFPTLTPVTGLYCWDYVSVMVKMNDPSGHKLPAVLSKLVKGVSTR